MCPTISLACRSKKGQEAARGIADTFFYVCHARGKSNKCIQAQLLQLLLMFDAAASEGSIPLSNHLKWNCFQSLLFKV
jgi:hypothetical protein